MASLFNKEWIDLVFEGRNKKYGAYQLRSQNPKTTTIALICGSLFFTALVAAPFIYNKIKAGMAETEKPEDEKIIEVVDIPVEIEEPLPPEPPKVEQIQAPKSVVEEIKFKPLEAAKKEDVPEDPPKTKDFEKANPSNQNKEAAPDGDIPVDAYAGDLEKGTEPKGEDDGIYATATLQVQPEFPGGMKAFYKYIIDNFRTPDLDRDMDLKIYVQFVVEKNGELTAIKIQKDPGHGAGKEAERVLKNLKTKWKPGIQNGKPVRASYNLPITIRVKSS
jgi:protein TonB